MGYSEVPKIKLNQDRHNHPPRQIPGFEEGTPVEISGQATQANGAVATFYSVQQMPAAAILERACLRW